MPTSCGRTSTGLSVSTPSCPTPSTVATTSTGRSSASVSPASSVVRSGWRTPSRDHPERTTATKVVRGGLIAAALLLLAVPLTLYVLVLVGSPYGDTAVCVAYDP